MIINFCKDCQHFDSSPFPEHGGKIALCRGKSWLYKIGHKTLAGACFCPKAKEVEKDAEKSQDKN